MGNHLNAKHELMDPSASDFASSIKSESEPKFKADPGSIFRAD
jgi:hypothetical protein